MITKSSSTFGKVTSLLGSGASFLYSAVQGISDGSDVTFGLLEVSGNETRNDTITFNDKITTTNIITVTDLAPAIAIGVLVGLITFITCKWFQGPLIEKYFRQWLSGENYNNVQEEELKALLGEPSFGQKFGYLAMKAGYCTLNIASEYLRHILLYSATKAWAQDIKDDSDNPLSLVSHREALLILLYFVLFVLPFIATNEMPESCKGIRKFFSIKKDQAPDIAITDMVTTVARRLARYPIFRKSVRFTGALTDTAKHVTSLVVIVPPSFVLKVANFSPVLAWGAGSLAISLASTIIFINSYLFEGSYTERTLKLIASGSNELVTEEPWLHPKRQAILHYLVALSAPLASAETGLSYLIALRELGAPEPVSWSVAFSTYAIACVGTYLSEVKESQAEIQRMVIPEHDIDYFLKHKFDPENPPDNDQEPSNHSEDSSESESTELSGSTWSESTEYSESSDESSDADTTLESNRTSIQRGNSY